MSKRLSESSNTLIYDTSTEQWRLYRVMRVFGVTRAKTFMGYYVNDGTIRGRVLLYPGIMCAIIYRGYYHLSWILFM